MYLAVENFKDNFVGVKVNFDLQFLRFSEEIMIFKDAEGGVRTCGNVK
jgi:hypothetical protein